MNDLKHTAAIVLAAGEGKRLNSSDKNKVVIKLGKKPMVEWTVERLKQAGVEEIIVVVGFAERTVREVLGKRVGYVVQKKQLGTGHATEVGLGRLDGKYKRVVVLYGDHSAFYTREFYRRLMKKHSQKKNGMTLVTVRKEDPSELAWGRIIRGKDGCVENIVEERDCSTAQKKIRELNAGAYVFERLVLEESLPTLEKHENGEYYLTDVAFWCMKNDQRVGAIEATEEEVGIGVNTPEQKKQAERMFGEVGRGN